MVTETGRDPRPSEPVHSPDRIDASFTDFEELVAIGSGGNADVTKQAYERQGPDVVALKQPRMQGTLDMESVRQFTDEAKTWAKLDDHDHVVGVLDYDSEPFPWIALEYMDGGSLDDRLGKLEPAEALWIGVCVARAVRHAHRRGIAHLDLKPDNVLFRETGDELWDVPKVTDWGLAKMLLEHSKSVEGLTPDYAAPEQFDSDTFGPPDDLTDVYATGALVYAALTGEPPFTGASASVMQDVLTTDPTPPSENVDGLPAGTDAVVTTALAKQKDDRYESVLDLRRDLETLVERVLGDGDEGSLIAEGGIPSSDGDSAVVSSDSGATRQDVSTERNDTGGGQPSRQPRGEQPRGRQPGATRQDRSGGTAAGDDAVQSDLLDIQGVGPSYARRLQDAGIRSVADLSVTASADVARAAEVSNSRAETWIDRANDVLDTRDEVGTTDAGSEAEEDDLDIPNYHYYMLGMGVLAMVGAVNGEGIGSGLALIGFVGYVYYWNKDMKTIQSNAVIDWYPMRLLYFLGSMVMFPVFYYYYKRSVALSKASVSASD